MPYLYRSDLEPVAKGSFYIEARLLPGGIPGDTSLVPVPQEACNEAKACLAALDEWEADEKARRSEVDRWEASQDRIHDLQGKVSEAIADLPANTMEGLNAKLAIIRAEPLFADEAGIAESALDNMRRIDTAACRH